MTVGLHLYKGMIVSLAIQSIMGPFGLFENVLVKALFFSSEGISPEAKLFDEKSVEELTKNDEVVDQQGNPVVITAASKKQQTIAAAAENDKPPKTLEEILLDTWDAGIKADLKPLMKLLTRKTCNHQTQADHWTPLMILAGLGELFVDGVLLSADEERWIRR